MKITSVESRLFRIPPKTPWADATHKVHGLEFLLVFIETDSDVSGIGLTYTVGVGGTAIKALVDDYCIPVLVDQDVDHIERIWKLLWNHLHRTGSGGINTLAIAGIDIALWDIWSKARQLPLWKALGGAQSSVATYGSGIDLLMEPEELKEHLSKYLASGYKWVKVKVGRESIHEDLKRLSAARGLIGPDVKLLIDANQCWTLDEAIPRCKAFEEFAPYWIEEPLLSENIGGHARLRQVTSIPIALGESLYGKRQFLDFLKAEAVDILQPDVARVGGYTEWLKIAHLADAYDKPVAPHYLMELSLSALCAVPNGLVLENVTGGGLTELGLLRSQVEIRNGAGYASEVPGHGLDFDFDALAPWEVSSGDLSADEMLSYRVK